MKNLITYILMVLLPLGALSSCDDFLTQENPNQIIVDNYWSNLDECESGMWAVYNQLRRQNAHQIIAENLRADIGYPGMGRPSPTNASNAAYYNQTFGNSDGAPMQKWAELYMGVFRANQVISGLEGIKNDIITDTDSVRWSELMAEARFFRGYFHFWIASSFNKGEVVISDFVQETEQDYYQKLQPEEKVRNFYRKDLKYAFDFLPSKHDGYANGERAAKAAAAFALAQTYLYQPIGADYDSAKIYLKYIIDSGLYDLESVDVRENMTTYGEYNNESILEIAYDRDLKPEEGSYSPATSTYSNYAQQLSSVGGWRSIFPSCWLIMAYKGDSLDVNDARNDYYYTDEYGDQQKVIRPYSLRTSYSIALVDDSLEYYGGKPAVTSNFQYNQSTANFRKLTNWDICENENDLNARSGVNYRLMRLADVYLMYAECLIKGGEDATGVESAITYVNKVRHRAGLRLLGENGEYPELGQDPSMPNTYMGNLIDFRNILGQEDPNNPIVQKDEFGNVVFDQRLLLNITEPKVLMQWLMFVERPLELCMEGMDTRLNDLRRWSRDLTWFDLSEYYTDLASRRYIGNNYAYTNSDGTTGTRWSSQLIHGVLDSYYGDQIFIDYEQAADNYIEEVHSYWPIPTDEVTANPNVN